MDVVLLQLPVHVRIVHAPHARLIPLQRRVDDGPPQALQGVGKAHIGGAVDQNRLPGAGQRLHHGADAAQDPVFIPDVPPLQAGYPVPRLLPADDAVIVGVRQPVVAEIGVAEPGLDGLQHRRRGGKAHIRYPHRDPGKARLGLHSGIGDHVQGQGIPSLPVQNGFKIILHGHPPFFMSGRRNTRRVFSSTAVSTVSGGSRLSRAISSMIRGSSREELRTLPRDFLLPSQGMSGST